MLRIVLTLALMATLSCMPVRAQQSANNDSSLSGPVATFDPAHQKPLSYKDESVQVTLIVGKEQNSLAIRTVATGKDTSIELPYEMAQVDEISRVIGDKLAVLGMVNGSGSEVVIIDLKTVKLIDRFACYSPAISSSGRYIAFIKIYPAHFAEGIEDHYMLYSLDLSPAENRPQGVGADNWLIAGRCLYPMNCKNEPGDNNGIPERSAHLSRSSFFWNPVKEEFFFADQVDSGGPITLVLVSIGANGKAALRTIEQPTESLCPKEAMGARACSLLVRKLVFHAGAEPTIDAVFEAVAVRQLRTLVYKYSQFQ